MSGSREFLLGRSVGIITDSIHGLSPELIERYDIRVAPMGVAINNKGYHDLEDITAGDFYKLLKEMKMPGTTSAPAPGVFLDIYESLAPKTEGVVYIGVSRILSATYSVAEQTRQMFQEGHPEAKIELIDSKNCLGALGYLVLEAARAAESRKSLKDVVGLVQAMIPRVKYFSLLQTLEHLVRIGRMPQSALTAQTSGIRPIIGMTDESGSVQNITAVPQQQALPQLVELAGKYMDSGKPVHAMVHYSENREEAEELKKLFTLKYNCVEFYMTEYSPAALCGTGLMTGLSFYT
jgi:DegV family protein with EDD domain